jgi:hypothetical protein
LTKSACSFVTDFTGPFDFADHSPAHGITHGLNC